METAARKFVLLNPPSLAGGLIFVFLFALVIYGSLRSTRHINGTKKRLTLIALHVLAFLAISIILLNPALRVESYTEDKRSLAVLVDESWSMNLAADRDGQTRIEAARGFLENNGDFFSGLEKNFFIDYYTFDEILKTSSQDSVLKEEPLGNRTDFGKVLKELKEKKESGELDDVIIISDGGDNGERADGIGEELKGAGLRINTVGALAEDRLDDIWIDEIKSSEVSFLRYPYIVEVAVGSSAPGGLKIPVSLYEENKLISIKEVSPDPASKKGTASFEINPVSLGRKIYTVSIPVVSKDSIPENNQKSFYTDVIINKIRVLHVAGSPSWDVRFLRKALKRNPNIDLVSFFILRDPSDLVFATENELSLIPFPVNDIFGSELGTFDVVIFQNFNFQPYGIFGFHLRSIRDYVTNEGGAFLMIGGNKSFDSGNYGRTPISEILPVELDYMPRTLSETVSGESVTPKLTIAGKNHPVMKIIPNKEENEKQWNNMPELEGFNMVHGLNPDAVPLLVSPEGEPVLAVTKAKSGKVAAFLSDSSWKWNFVRGSEGDVSPYYDKFWNRLFLWFVNDPELDDIRIETDKAIYNPGENPEIKITVLDEASNAGDIKPALTLPDGTSLEIRTEKISEERYVKQIEAPEPGIYKISADLSPGAGDSTDSNEISFAVVPPEMELQGPTENVDLLKSIARATGGSYIGIRGNPERLKIDNAMKKTVTGYETMELWDNPVFLLLIMALLFSEWFLRRRWGLK